MFFMNNSCYHCGKNIDKKVVYTDRKSFCCNGCKTVYEILNENNLSEFYSFNKTPGIEPDKKVIQQFNFLDTDKVFNKLTDFSDDGYTVVTFFIPVIHCTSCVWLLESLPKINVNVTQCQVNFTKKSVTITYKSNGYKLSELAIFLTDLGYKPIISLDNINSPMTKANSKRLLLQLAIAFFSAGNIMLLALPDYIGGDSKWLEGNFKPFFGWLMLLLSMPVVFYSAQDYFKSAFKGIEYDNFNIDIPVSIGITTLFLRSVYEVVTGYGYGYFDSLSGFVFFLLIGKYFQERTYDYLSFEKDYKSFYPIAVTKINNNKEENIILSDLKKGDRILIRNEEIIPADAILLNGDANIDNSFITGESRLIKKISGDKIFAGGKQIGSVLEVEIIKDVNQSYLTKLWNNKIFNKEDNFKIITDRISKKFTFIVLFIAFTTGVIWWFVDSLRVFEIVTAVLIVACPCALALSAPFTFGNMMRILSNNGFYVKNIAVIENISRIDSIVFDKTGTITENDDANVFFKGEKLSMHDEIAIKSLTKNSNHPLSRIIYNYLFYIKAIEIECFEEISGKGSKAIINDVEWKIGSLKFIESESNFQINKTRVYIKKDNDVLGYFQIENKYRESINEVISRIKDDYSLTILSGDNDSEKGNLLKIMPENTPLFFNQSPKDKLEYNKKIQDKGCKVLMIGDGLNDSGALKQSDVGVSIVDDVNGFSPSCDVILDGKAFDKLPLFFLLSKISVILVKTSFFISLLYNVVGITFAIFGKLSPLIAAILMPLSSISVVFFSTLSTYFVGEIKKN